MQTGPNETALYAERSVFSGDGLGVSASYWFRKTY